MEACSAVVCESVTTDSLAALHNKQSTGFIKLDTSWLGQPAGDKLCLPAIGNNRSRVAGNENVAAGPLCQSTRSVETRSGQDGFLHHVVFCIASPDAGPRTKMKETKGGPRCC